MKNQRGEGEIIGLIVIGLLIWGGLGIYHHVRPNYSKPWFKGETAAYVCKRPWYNLNECYIEKVESDGTQITSINFSKGGYLIQQGGECYETVPDVGNDKHNCTLDDTNGDTWDVFPAN